MANADPLTFVPYVSANSNEFENRASDSNDENEINRKSVKRDAEGLPKVA